MRVWQGIRGKAAIRRWAAWLALPAALLIAVPASGQQSPTVPAPAKPLQAQVFTHPTKNFSAVIPPGADVVQRSQNFDLSVQSRKGYLIHVQTGTADLSVPLPRMMARFEAQYVGAEKPLKRMLGERAAVVAGLPGHEAAFEGTGTRARLAIGRGAKTDFVFMFFAPLANFENLEPEFDWFLQYFEPPEAERPATRTVAAAVAPAEEKPSPKRAIAPSPPVLTLTFSDREAGYTIAYPADWLAERPSGSISLFSGPEGSDAARASVTIQNVLPTDAKAPGGALAQVMGALRSQLAAGANNVRYLGEGVFTYSKGGLKIEGHQLLLSYSRDGERVRQWTVVLPRPRANTVHVWSYASPEASYDSYRPIADAMLKAWTIELKG